MDFSSHSVRNQVHLSAASLGFSYEPSTGHMGSMEREERVPSTVEVVQTVRMAQSPGAGRWLNGSWVPNVHRQEHSGTGTPFRSRRCRQGSVREPDLLFERCYVAPLPRAELFELRFIELAWLRSGCWHRSTALSAIANLLREQEFTMDGGASSRGLSQRLDIDGCCLGGAVPHTVQALPFRASPGHAKCHSTLCPGLAFSISYFPHPSSPFGINDPASKRRPDAGPSWTPVESPSGQVVLPFVGRPASRCDRRTVAPHSNCQTADGSPATVCEVTG